MTYKVELTNSGWASLYDCVDYLAFSVGGTGNMQAVINFVDDYENTIRCIKRDAVGYNLVDEPNLRTHNIRKIHFLKMHYKILYRVEGNTAYIESIVHGNQSLANVRIGF